MPAGPRENQRVAIDHGEPRVVPSTAKVFALLVVRGRAEPGRLGPPRRRAPRRRRSTAPSPPRGRWRPRRSSASRPRRTGTCSGGRPSGPREPPGRGRRPAGRGRGSPRQRCDAAAVVPPGTRPRSRSDATRPASTSRADETDPGKATRGREDRRPGRFRQRASSMDPSGLGTNRRNWEWPGGASPAAARRSRPRLPPRG